MYESNNTCCEKVECDCSVPSIKEMITKLSAVTRENKIIVSEINSYLFAVKSEEVPITDPTCMTDDIMEIVKTALITNDLLRDIRERMG